MLSVLYLRAQFEHAPGHGRSEQALLGRVRCQRDVAEHVPDQADDRLGCALAHRDRAKRGHGQHRDAVCRADMSDHPRKSPRGRLFPHSLRRSSSGYARGATPATVAGPPIDQATAAHQLPGEARRAHPPFG
jgi:hypothetical protein